MRRSVLSILLASLIVATTTPIASGASEPDPLGIVPFADTVQRTYTLGTDVWEVWVCRAANLDPIVNLTESVAALNANISPFFEDISTGAYEPVFVAGSDISIPGDIVVDGPPETPFAGACEEEVAKRSKIQPAGALILTDAPFDSGYGTQGAVCPEPPFGGCEVFYPDNARTVVVGAATVTTVEPFTSPQWITLAHELGHAIGWPHSYSGLTTDPLTGEASRYDNPMDLMSGGIHTGDPIGTIAYNRYSAGWIAPGNVKGFVDLVATYSLSSDPSAGTQMVVIPTGTNGLFLTLGARRRPPDSYDAVLPKSGVEVYVIDQRREVACSLPSEWPESWPCFSIFTRIMPFPRSEGLDAVDHVLGLDDSITAFGVTITVTGAANTAFSVRVAKIDSGSFLDDDGNIHEANIEAIAALNITTGCGEQLYCPDQKVTRAQMAALLVRALGLEDAIVPYNGPFTDVDPDAWYAPYVGTLADLGIAQGTPSGEFLPSATVTRAQAAAFLVRAFDHLTESGLTTGFKDVFASDWFSGYVQALVDGDVTRGCSAEPLLYCPDSPVRRDQMASLLARTLGIGS